MQTSTNEGDRSQRAFNYVDITAINACHYARHRAYHGLSCVTSRQHKKLIAKLFLTQQKVSAIVASSATLIVTRAFTSINFHW